jgi:hypothetical protein
MSHRIVLVTFPLQHSYDSCLRVPVARMRYHKPQRSKTTVPPELDDSDGNDYGHADPREDSDLG